MNKATSNKIHSNDWKVVKVKTQAKGLGTLKTVIIFILIAVQLAILMYFYFKYLALLKTYLICSFILSLITCVYLLSSKKNSHAKAVWIMFLLLFFSFGYILFFLSDERIFFGKAKRRYKKVFTDSKVYEDKLRLHDGVKNGDEIYLKNVGNFESYKNTATKYFSSGTLLFDDILYSMSLATEFIFIEFFIISDGVLLERFLNILEEKANEGVDVRIIYDDMGSHGTLSRKTKKRMKENGIKLHPFNRLVPLISVAMNFRDHRKLVIIDGKTAYTGGANLSDEYINEKRILGYWKDAGIRLDGDGVDGFTMIFLRQWQYLSSKEEDYSLFLRKSHSVINTNVVIPYADGLEYDIPIGKDMYLNIMSESVEKIFIMTPYFIIEDTITNMLINKALSGVDVRIVLPGIPDKKSVYDISKNNAEKLLKYGVKVYLVKNSFVHSKLVLTENCAIVGSINMDLRSFFQQFESAVYLNDSETICEINRDFENTFTKSETLVINQKKKMKLFNRMYVGLLRVMSPFM